jgi:hypothetical protein
MRFARTIVYAFEWRWDVRRRNTIAFAHGVGLRTSVDFSIRIAHGNADFRTGTHSVHD